MPQRSIRNASSASPPWLRLRDHFRRSPPLAAATAGLAASLPMLAVMDLLNRALPGEAEEHRLPPLKVTRRIAEEADLVDRLPPVAEHVAGFVAHLGFGSSMGLVYGALAGRASGPPVAKGILFGLCVWAFSYAGWLPATGIMPPPHRRSLRRNVVILASHLVWGAILGPLTQRMLQRGWRPGADERRGNEAAPRRLIPLAETR